jgi:hypothetical protein
MDWGAAASKRGVDMLYTYPQSKVAVVADVCCLLLAAYALRLVAATCSEE